MPSPAAVSPTKTALLDVLSCASFGMSVSLSTRHSRIPRLRTLRINDRGRVGPRVPERLTHPTLFAPTANVLVGGLPPPDRSSATATGLLVGQVPGQLCVRFWAEGACPPSRLFTGPPRMARLRRPPYWKLSWQTDALGSGQPVTGAHHALVHRRNTHPPDRPVHGLHAE